MAQVNHTSATLPAAQGLVPPRPAHVLDNAALLSYLQHHVPGLVSYHGGLQVLQFSHGQSNPTYLLQLENLHLVLRKKPPGKLLASAHAVEREYQVLAALADTPVPVPRVLSCCDDPRVIGTPFYIMEFVEGQIHLDPNLPDVVPATRTAMYRQLAHALAALHEVKPTEVGLGSFGSTANYCRRQLNRWRKQYLASVQQPMGEMLQLMSWLQDHIPAADADASEGGVVHGDYRLDNCVFSAGPEPRLRAILDWELATLGNTWADVAYCCMNLYHLPPGMPLMQSARQPYASGIPEESEFLSWYCHARRCQMPSSQDWAFYLALSIFRVVAILAGVQARAKQGNASSVNASRVAADGVLRMLLGTALQLVHRSKGSTAQESDGSAVRAMQMVTSRHAPRVEQLRQAVADFILQHVIPAEGIFEAHAVSDNRWSVHPLMEELKQKARSQGLWNLWLPGEVAAKLHHLLDLSDEQEKKTLLGASLSNLEYAIVCEEMGHSVWAPEVFNCSAPDTGNMEVLARYGSVPQQTTWLLPLLQGKIRSCFAMTEMKVASSDATNIQASIVREGGEYVLNGVKWWTSGATDPRCQVSIFMGKTDPTGPVHRQQSMILVPMDARGVKVVRPLLVFGIDDAPHGHAEVHFTDVRVPVANMVLGEGRGFEIAQGRLGPGRLHHCMRLIGHAERAMSLMARRALSRTVFGKTIAQQGAFQSDLAKCRIELEAARLLVLNAAHTLDQLGNKAARGALAAAKVAVPNTVLQVLDTAIQVHGAAGVSQDTPLSRLWINARTLRLADGPDEVHLGTLAKMELARASRL